MKTRILGKIFSAAIALSLAAQPALAAVPQRILYQGTLRQTGGLYTGNATFLFRITNSSGGTEYWNSGSTVVAVTSGLFRYPLGTDNPGTGPDESASFLTIDWSNISPYIEVTVNGNLRSPREEIQSVPYAIFNSAATDSVNPRVMRSGDTMTGQLTLYGSTLTVTGNAFSVGVSTLVVKDGNVGIGTSSPSTTLHVSGTAPSIRLEHTSGPDITMHTNDGSGFAGIKITEGTNLLSIQDSGDTVLGRASGSVGIGISNPSSKLHVLNGDIRISTNDAVSRGIIFKDGTTQTTAAMGGNLWADRGSNDISNTNTAKVGIGITNPSFTLDVNGSVNTSDARGLYQLGARVFASSNTNVLAGETAGAASQADAFDNVFVGSSAGDDNTSGDDNVFIGYSAGDGNTTGIRNTFIGSNAGASNISGSRNVFLGYQAGFSETNSDKLYIDNSNAASPLIWGDFNTNVVNVTGSLGIGLTNPSGSFETFNDVNAPSLMNISNPNAGTVAYSELNLRNDSGAQSGLRITAMGTGFTTAEPFVQDAGAVIADLNLSGGLSVGSRAAAPVRFYANGTEYMRLTSGGLIGMGAPSPSASYRLTLRGDGSVSPLGGLAMYAGANSGAFLGYPTAANTVDFELWNANNGYLRFGANNAEQMRITNAGIVDMPNQSAARAYRSGSVQSIPDVGFTQVQLNGEDFDRQNEFDTGAYTFTATRAGYYSVSGTVTYTGLTDQMWFCALIYKNGGMVARNNVGASGANDQSSTVTTVVYLAVGDNIALYTYQNSGGAKNINFGTAETYLSVVKQL
ncbi:MAG: hypothetical protein HZB91_08640 [Elusimicrobia bacterium]|nr:hypothetical protein [Elusimicrobiota bacterium]